jgi:hypothetical protein
MEIKPLTNAELYSCSNYSKLLCPYDGIKMRRVDQEYIDYLLSEQQKEKFKIIKTSFGRIEYYTGKYENFDISIHYTPEGWVADLSGSVHKFHNKGEHNYNDFYYADFLKVLQRLRSELNLDLLKTKVVGLEVGVNLDASSLKLTLEEVIERVLFMFNKCNKRNRQQEKLKDIFKVSRGEKYIKIYNKGLQYKVQPQILRMELGYTRSRQLQKDARVVNLFDLTKIETMIQLCHQLISAFATLHTFEPELNDLPGLEIKATPEIKKYYSPSFWCNLRKTKPHLYIKHRKNQSRLIRVYGLPDTSNSLLRLLKEKLKLE